MKKITTEMKENSSQINIILMLLIILISLPTSLCAKNTTQEQYNGTDNAAFNFYYKQLNNSQSGEDVIFKSTFEPVPVLSMSANPEAINSGNSSVISWTLSNNADSCLKSGDWSGTFTESEVSNGMHTLSLPNITSNSTYNLICSNAFGDSQLRSATVMIIDSPPVLTNFIATPTTAPVNGSTTLSWTISNNATVCTKSGAWSGMFTGVDVTNGDHSVTVTNITGDSTFLLRCSNTLGVTPLHSVEVMVDTNLVLPLLTNFTATPILVSVGGSSTLSWDLTGNATACTKSGSWSGSLSGADVANGIHNATITNITVNSTYHLQCSNNTGDSQSVSTTVTLQQPTDCSNQLPILKGLEDFTILSNNTGEGDLYDGTYHDMTSGTGWPGDFDEAIRLTLTQSQYVAAVFDSGNANRTARLSFISPSVNQGPPSAGMAVAISACPGDFSVHLNQSTCLVNAGGAPNFRWSTNPSASAALYCKLEKNKTYFLNIVHSNNSENDNFATSDCDDDPGYCGILAFQAKEIVVLNNPPIISDIMIPAFNENTASDVVNFLVDDIETFAGDLAVTAVSSNQSIVMDSNIVISSGNAGERSVQIIPNTNANTQFDNVSITLSVSDGSDSTNQVVNLTILDGE